MVDLLTKHGRYSTSIACSIGKVRCLSGTFGLVMYAQGSSLLMDGSFASLPSIGMVRDISNQHRSSRIAQSSRAEIILQYTSSCPDGLKVVSSCLGC